MKKRNLIISVLLSIAMLVTMLPLAVFADEPAETGGGAGPQILTSGNGAKNSPVVYDYEQYEDVEEGEETGFYYASKTLTAKSKVVYLALQAQADSEYRFFVTAWKGAAIKNVVLLDADYKTVGKFKLDKSADHPTYVYKHLNLSVGDLYYVKVTLSKSKKNAYIASNSQEYTETGAYEKPMLMYNDGGCYESYYSQTYECLKRDQYWFKATIECGGKIKASVSADFIDGSSVIDSAKVYVGSKDTTPIALSMKDYEDWTYLESAYFNADDDEVVYICVEANDKMKANHVISCDLSYKNINNAESNTIDMVGVDEDLGYYTYTGEEHEPLVYDIVCDNELLVPGRDYDPEIRYNNNIYCGIMTAEIDGKGEYFGTLVITFDIKPLPTSIKTVKGGKGTATVTWKKSDMEDAENNVDGYYIYYSKNKNFNSFESVKVKGLDKTSKTIKKLKKGTYYFAITTYKSTEDYWDVESDWSKVKKVVVK